jgi:hypothetical protein
MEGSAERQVALLRLRRSCKAGGSAAIYVWGMVNNERAIWGSGDNGQTWTKLGAYPTGSLDAIKTISGDMARPGRVYVGFGGSGSAYLEAI